MPQQMLSCSQLFLSSCRLSYTVLLRESVKTRQTLVLALEQIKVLRQVFDLS